MDFNEEAKLIYKQEIYAEWISRNMPSERGGGVKIQSLNEKKQIVLRQSLCVTATKAGAASPLPTLELSLSISCYKTHLSFYLFCFWTWFFDSGFKIDCTLYNISSWFKGMLMFENFCHIITLLSSSVILCWFWSLQITGKRTNNLLVTKLFNWAWLSAAPGSCWCCQLIFFAQSSWFEMQTSVEMGAQLTAFAYQLLSWFCQRSMLGLPPPAAHWEPPAFDPPCIRGSFSTCAPGKRKDVCVK